MMTSNCDQWVTEARWRFDERMSRGTFRLSIMSNKRAARELLVGAGTITIIAGTLALLAAPVAAAPPMVAPTATLLPVVHITGFQTVAAPAGMLKYQVTLHNDGAAATMLDVNFCRRDDCVGKHDRDIVHIPAKSDATVFFTSKADRMNCGIGYLLWLFGDGADTTVRNASLDAQCTWATQVSDSLNAMTADQRHRTIAGKAFLSAALAPTFSSCDLAKVSVEVENHTTTTANQLVVVLQDINGTMVGQQLVPALAAGQSHRVVVTGEKINGAAGTMTLSLRDPTHAFSDKIVPQTVDIQISPTCTATTHLTP